MGIHDADTSALGGALPTTLGLVTLTYLVFKLAKVLWIGFAGPLSKVPGPWTARLTALPWLGTVAKGKSFELGIQYNRHYGGIVRIAPDLVLVSDAKAVHEILVEKDLRKSIIYEKFRQDPKVASILTIRDRPVFRARRRLLANGFSTQYLKGLEPQMLGCIQVLEDVLDERCAEGGGETVVNAWNLLGSLTTDIMSETSFGGSFELVKNGEHPLRERFTKALKRSSIYQVLPFMKWIFGHAFQDPELKRIIDEIITRRKQLSDEKRGKPDLLALLLDTHEQHPEVLNYKEVIAEMFVFLIAGSETSAATMTFALMFLLENPDACQKLVVEIRQRFPAADSPVSEDRMKDLPFLDAVLKETLRLRPVSAAGMARLLSYVAKTRITANTTLLHWSDEQWPDADRFVPERWLSEYKGKAASEKTAWYPFSAGTRTCIGKQFAWNELRLVLVSLLRRYDLSVIPDQSQELVNFTVLQLKSARYMVGVKPRA
ncbi:Cytochrome P450 monooxygenase FUS8 [Colletotrichum sidae]|uniref:Cytochrome P450 monooxygenase FUS8 n=1 Tax=Colletotrichum sidae TaxID=1347389 RepID=A0A4R8TFI2_9PEZI|nr:Cytochrome P450 monooxygenase FUS8 [Colletotrichum sidae]